MLAVVGTGLQCGPVPVRRIFWSRRKTHHNDEAKKSVQHVTLTQRKTFRASTSCCPWQREELRGAKQVFAKSLSGKSIRRVWTWTVDKLRMWTRPAANVTKTNRYSDSSKTNRYSDSKKANRCSDCKKRPQPTRTLRQEQDLVVATVGAPGWDYTTEALTCRADAQASNTSLEEKGDLLERRERKKGLVLCLLSFETNFMKYSNRKV